LKILGIDPTNTAALEVQVTEDGIRLTAANEYD